VTFIEEEVDMLRESGIEVRERGKAVRKVVNKATMTARSAKKTAALLGEEVGVEELVVNGVLCSAFWDIKKAAQLIYERYYIQ
jgi:hypothetical protein